MQWFLADIMEHFPIMTKGIVQQKWQQNISMKKKIQENLLVPKSFHKQVWQKQMATLRETNSDMKTLISDQLVSARKM